jgi:hypothetical protein
MFSKSKIISIVFLLSIIFLSLLLSFTMSRLRDQRENFEETGYTSSLLNTLGPIIFDSSTLSTDKIASLQKMNPPITDQTVVSLMNSTGDADGIISNIKNYLGSCPSSSSTQ